MEVTDRSILDEDLANLADYNKLTVNADFCGQL